MMNYNITDGRQKKVVLRFSSDMKQIHIEKVFFKEKAVPFCYSVALATEAEAGQYRYNEKTASEAADILNRMNRQRQAAEARQAAEQARQAEAEQARQEKEKACKWYSDIYEYLKDSGPDCLVPIHKHITATCKTFYSKNHSFKKGMMQVTEAGKAVHKLKYAAEADAAYMPILIDCITLTRTGRLHRTDNFDAYVNQTYICLKQAAEMIQADRDSFTDDIYPYSLKLSDRMNKAFNKAGSIVYRELHGGRFSWTEAATFDGMTEAEQESVLTYHERYNTELSALKATQATEALQAMTAEQTDIIALKAAGYTFNQIAGILNGRTEGRQATEAAVKMQAYRGQKAAIEATYQNEGKCRQARQAYYRQKVEAARQAAEARQAEAEQAHRPTGRLHKYEAEAARQAAVLLYTVAGYGNYYYDMNGNLKQA